MYKARPLVVPVQYQPRYRPYSLPKVIPKLRYVEIDDFNNPSCTPPSTNDIASFTTRLGEQSKAITSVRKRGPRRSGDAPRRSKSPVAGPSRLPVRAISVSSSDSAIANAGAPSSGSSGNPDVDSDLQLRRLQTGQGLTFKQWMGICMRCPECDYYFLQGKVFEKHVKNCFGA